MRFASGRDTVYNLRVHQAIIENLLKGQAQQSRQKKSDGEREVHYRRSPATKADMPGIVRMSIPIETTANAYTGAVGRGDEYQVHLPCIWL